MRCVSNASPHSHFRSSLDASVSVVGIIAIPGMMTRAILDGSDVEQAARLQMIIMFMISASSALSCIVATHLVLRVCVDSEHRIRSDCIDTRPHALRRACDEIVQAAVSVARRKWALAIDSTKCHVQEGEGIGNGSHANSPSEHTPLFS